MQKGRCQSGCDAAQANESLNAPPEVRMRFDAAQMPWASDAGAWHLFLTENEDTNRRVRFAHHLEESMIDCVKFHVGK
jgi:hypothetical protein